MNDSLQPAYSEYSATSGVAIAIAQIGTALQSLILFVYGIGTIGSQDFFASVVILSQSVISLGLFFALSRVQNLGHSETAVTTDFDELQDYTIVGR